MPDGAVLDEGEPVQAREPFAAGPLDVGQFVLGPLPGDRHLGLAGLAHPQGHHPVLGGADAGLERAGQVVAANVHEVPTLLLAPGSELHLVGAL